MPKLQTDLDDGPGAYIIVFPIVQESVYQKRDVVRRAFSGPLFWNVIIWSLPPQTFPTKEPQRLARVRLPFCFTINLKSAFLFQGRGSCIALVCRRNGNGFAQTSGKPGRE